MSKSNSEVFRYYLREVVNNVGTENVPMVFGAEKVCYIFNHFVIFVEDIPAEFTEKQVHNILMTKLIRQQHAQYLHNCGIKVPRILDIQMENNQIIESQEKAPGEILFYTNESNILNLFGDKEMKRQHTSFKDMTEEYRIEFCEKLLQRNIDMQKKLKNAPIQHITKFLSDFKALEEYGLDLDLHGENFLYSHKDGFTFIDLPNQQSTDNKKFDINSIANSNLIFDDKKINSIEKYRTLPHAKILYDACKLLYDSLKYAGYAHNWDLVKKIKKNNTVLVEKLIQASKLAHFKISEKEYNQIRELCKGFCHEIVKENENSI
jgi:hypothetical protein